jgi:hypothetical protein
MQKITGLTRDSTAKTLNNLCLKVISFSELPVTVQKLSTVLISVLPGVCAIIQCSVYNRIST